MRAKTVNFERGQDPKKTLDVGKQSLVKDIDSHDLFLVTQYSGYGHLTPEEGEEHLREKWMYDGEDDFQIYLNRAKEYWRLLKGHLIWDQRDGWDARAVGESSGILDYVEMGKNGTTKKYAYDYTPDGDYVNIVWSDIELPAATSIEEVVEMNDF